MLDFIRADIAELAAYTPHPGGKISVPLDRLDTNESPLDLPPELKEKLAWTYQKEIETNRYPDGSHAALKGAIAHYANESAMLDSAIDPENISIGNGSDELIRSILIATCLGGHGSILVADPTFSMYEILAKTLGIPVHKVKRREMDFAIDTEGAKKKIEQTNDPPIRVIFVVHPNSPTANPLTAAEVEWLCSLPKQILVVIDEAYFEYSLNTVVGKLSRFPNWIVLRTFSKAFRLAALRVGYCIGDRELITALEKVRLPYNLPAFSQAAVMLALNNRQLILPHISQILGERDRLFSALSHNLAIQVWPSVANFIYLRLKTSPETAQEKHAQLCQALKEQGTLVRHTGGGLRITVGTKEENTRTINRLEQLLKAYKTIKQSSRDRR